MYQIYVRDSELNRVAPVEGFKSLDLVSRFNGVGAFELNLPTNTEAAQELLKPKSGIVVVKNGYNIFSGPVASRKRTWNSSTDTMLIRGFDDNVHLNRRLVYPEKNGNFSLQDYDVLTGKAGSIIRLYVDVNMGPSALPERRVQKLIFEVDKGIGEVVTGRGRFHNLLEFCQSLALAGGDIGFKIIQEGGNLIFKHYVPTDKTKSVIFSPLYGNLVAFEYSKDDPETNYSIVGGSGEGAERLLLQKGDSPSISEYGRIETFIDRRDTLETDELNQALDEELASKVVKTGLSITPIDTENSTFGTDYMLGDKVSVILNNPDEKANEPEVIQDVIREVKISITQNGASVSPIIGTPDSLKSNTLGFFNKVNKRVSNLERR